MVEPGQLQMFNKPDPSELFTLPHGVEHHVEYEKDPKIENAGTYIMWLEDHTIGNALRMQLLRNQHVLFAGYRVPHPLTNNIEIKIQTTENSTPCDAMRQAHQELITETKDILQQFQSQMIERGLFPEPPEIADIPHGEDDEATSNRFSEVSSTEEGFQGEDLPLQQLQDDNDNTWVRQYNELEQKLQIYASATNKPIPIRDSLMEDEYEDMMPSMPPALASSVGMTSGVEGDAQSAVSVPPSVGAFLDRMDSGDYVESAINTIVLTAGSGNLSSEGFAASSEGFAANSDVIPPAGSDLIMHSDIFAFGDAASSEILYPTSDVGLGSVDSRTRRTGASSQAGFSSVHRSSNKAVDISSKGALSSVSVNVSSLGFPDSVSSRVAAVSSLGFGDDASASRVVPSSAEMELMDDASSIGDVGALSSEVVAPLSSHRGGGSSAASVASVASSIAFGQRRSPGALVSNSGSEKSDSDSDL